MENQNRDQKILESIKQMDYFKGALEEEKNKIFEKIHKKKKSAIIADVFAEGPMILTFPASILATPVCLIMGKGFDYGLLCSLTTLFGGLVASSIPLLTFGQVCDKIQNKIEELYEDTKKCDAKAEELEQMKHLLDQTLLREGVDLSVLKERYAEIISDKDKLLENEDENKEELHALYPLLKKYQTRINAINKVVEEEKQKEYLEEIHQECAQILDAESMVFEYSGGKALLKARGI